MFGGGRDGRCDEESVPAERLQVFERARRGDGEEDRGDIQVQEA